MRGKSIHALAGFGAIHGVELHRHKHEGKPLPNDSKPVRRTFLGRKPGPGVKLSQFDKKHLKTYLRGHSQFEHKGEIFLTQVTYE